ncbi:hypothetical protein DOY81_011942 [Sarcophaga bullata]|nr:hypothetical protein DOY81_011942 [Sarcophaga bullata]
MGRICPILNHPLNDGVLIEDEALISFIQKRNVDFLPNELVCRSCKHEVTKLYNKKLKKAIELHRSRYHEGSISSLKTSKNSTSSGASTTSGHSVSLRESQQKGIQAQGITQNVIARSAYDLTTLQQNGNETNASGDSNRSSSSKAENQINLANTQSSNAANSSKNVTIRKKRTIRDFLTLKPKELIPQHASIFPVVVSATEIITPSLRNKTKGILRTVSPLKKKPLAQHVTYDTEVEIRETTAVTRISNVSTSTNSNQTAIVQMQTQAIPTSTTPAVTYANSLLINDNNDDDVNRRLSQEPTTSKAAAAGSSTSASSSKRPISAVTEDDDDDDGGDQSLSLNAFNGTRLPTAITTET